MNAALVQHLKGFTQPATCKLNMRLPFSFYNLPACPEGTMSAVYLLLLLLPLVSAQTYRWGPCPTPKVQPNFNLQQVKKKKKTLIHAHITHRYTVRSNGISLLTVSGQVV